MAQAMMCVNDAFDCPMSARCVLMTRRFSSRTLTGMLRMDVAVGTLSDASMFATIFDAAPRRGTALPGTTCNFGAGAGGGSGVAAAALGRAGGGGPTGP